MLENRPYEELECGCRHYPWWQCPTTNVQYMDWTDTYYCDGSCGSMDNPVYPEFTEEVIAEGNRIYEEAVANSKGPSVLDLLD